MITIKEDIHVNQLASDELGRKNLVLLMVNAIKGKVATTHRAMTMGVYGSWGEGKTSLMRMVDSELKKVCIPTVWYNPWTVAGENEMLIDFFSMLARNTFEDETTAAAIESYGRGFLAKPCEVTYSPVSASYMTRLSQCIPTAGKNLAELKDSISKKLKESDKHLVVFIDDVDRLSTKEVHTVFKLIRQIADFDNVVYVMGIDPAAVADSLDASYYERSAKERNSRGRAFLEKIIQVPIVLPSIDETILQQQIERTICEVAKEFEIDVDQKSIILVAETLSEVFTTKRAIVRYGNQLRFVLPSIYKEVEIVDLCLMESLKYLNEEGWVEIYRQKSNLFGEIPYIPEESVRNKAIGDAFDVAVKAIVERFDIEKRAYVESVLRNHLFTKIHHYATNGLSKSVNNKIYFGQYFICGVPERIIPRDEAVNFAELVKDDEGKAIEWINEKMLEYPIDEIDRTTRLVPILVENVSVSETAGKLCRVLAFSDLSKGYTKYLVTNPNSIDLTITAVVIPQYMVEIEDNGNRVQDTAKETEVLKDIYGNAPLNFCMNVFYGVYSDRCFLPDDEKGVFDVLKARVLAEGNLAIFEYSYNIARVFMRKWKELDMVDYEFWIDSVVKDGNFDAGKFVVNSLSAVGDQKQLMTVAEITDLFLVVWNEFKTNLNSYKDKEDKLYKLFVFNCGQLKKEMERNCQL